MMKRFLIAAIALATTLPAAFNLQAQDDDIYFSKKAHKKATKDAVYAETAADEWATNANDDWDLDAYNRRGNVADSIPADSIAEEPAFYYEIKDSKGNISKVPGNKKILKDSDLDVYKVKNDTMVLVEQYHFSDLIRRFHNPFFGYWSYSPWYDVAYYDPFYWDYCYYDPWWYMTPSFGFHWGGWYGGWDFGYYSGWYGGWYSPYYHPMPHYHNIIYVDGPVYVYGGGSYVGSHRGSSRNNFGGHFAHRGGWRGDGGSNRMASASSNRSYRAANGARTTRSYNGITTNGPSLRGRNTSNGRIAHSTMRSNSGIRSVNGNNNTTRNYGTSTSRGNRTSAGSNDNSTLRRIASGVRQADNGATINREGGRGRRSGSVSSSPSYNNGSSYSSSNYGNHSATRYSGSNSNSSYSSGGTRSYSNSSSSYSGGGSHSSGGGFSGGGGGGSHSHSGSHAGRR